MQRTHSKHSILSEYTNKILSVRRSTLITPFPRNIDHILATYINISFFALLLPHRLKYNPDSGGYETKTSIIQLALFTFLWSGSCITFSGRMLKNILELKKKTTVEPADILLLLGGMGHFSALMSHLATSFYYREELRQLLNYFVMHSSTNKVPIGKHNLHTGKAAESTEIQGSMMRRRRGFFTFRRISTICSVLTLVIGIKCTTVIDNALDGLSPTARDMFDVYAVANLGFGFDLKKFLEGPSLLPAASRIFIELVLWCANMEKLIGVLIYGLEFTVALTMKCIGAHLVRNLTEHSDIWKPTSGCITSSISVVREAYNRMNQVFGWMFFYTIMGEFPNFTFYVVFTYTSPEAPMQWSYKVGLVYVFLILSVSSWAVNDFIKVKEWIQCEGKNQWSKSARECLRQRIILFELALNRYTLSAHGFFRLSLPAFLSIAVGILSNTLILIQLIWSSGTDTSGI